MSLKRVVTQENLHHRIAMFAFKHSLSSGKEWPERVCVWNGDAYNGDIYTIVWIITKTHKICWLSRRYSQQRVDTHVCNTSQTRRLNLHSVRTSTYSLSRTLFVYKYTIYNISDKHKQTLSSYIVSLQLVPLTGHNNLDFLLHLGHFQLLTMF